MSMIVWDSGFIFQVKLSNQLVCNFCELGTKEELESRIFSTLLYIAQVLVKYEQELVPTTMVKQILCHCNSISLFLIATKQPFFLRVWSAWSLI